MAGDSGMTFERNTTLFGNDSVQTLEPRIYYLRVPYRDQSEIPVFDTGVATFNFTQAFSENLFSGGWDRIANANQVTRSEEHTSELQSLMRISYAVFCLKKQTKNKTNI